jgi:transcriptional regulator with PAS, ATPase and Fis domain
VNTAPLKNKKDEIVGGVEIFHDLIVVEALRREVESRYKFADIISKNPKMQDIFALLPKVAESGSTILIEGESGTGKELCARALHENSPRCEAPFVTVNCSALPASLLESELFGHVQGAFTGADRHRKGLFREAHGGTLFLDEVGEMPQGMQAKLLRVLQESEVRPVGGDRAFKVDVRILSATNRSLASMAETGLFRRDLLYRLAVVRVEMPPLSARREDLPELCDHLLRRAAKKMSRPPKRIDRTALDLISRHPLPGNVRQLENILTEAFLMTDAEVITAAGLAIPADSATTRQSRRAAVEAYDREVILEALAECGWNKRKTADALGISRPTLYRRMRQYNIPKERPPSKI